MPGPRRRPGAPREVGRHFCRIPNQTEIAPRPAPVRGPAPVLAALREVVCLACRRVSAARGQLAGEAPRRVVFRDFPGGGGPANLPRGAPGAGSGRRCGRRNWVGRVGRRGGTSADPGAAPPAGGASSARGSGAGPDAPEQACGRAFRHAGGEELMGIPGEGKKIFGRGEYRLTGGRPFGRMGQGKLPAASAFR